MSLDTTLGGSTSDSFATLVEIRTIASLLKKIPYYRSIIENLDAIDDTVMEEVAKIATINIDGFSFIGQRMTQSQSLSWPRTGKRLSLSFHNVIPESVKKAQVLEMASLMSGPVIINDEISNDIAAGIKSKSMGKRSVTYGKSTSIDTRKNISKLAREILDRTRLLSNNVYMPRG